MAKKKVLIDYFDFQDFWHKFLIFIFELKCGSSCFAIYLLFFLI